MSSTTLTAATAHTTMATAAVTVPALAPRLSQLTFLTARENLQDHVGSASWATRRRSSSGFSEVKEQPLRTCSFRPPGGEASGSRPKSAAGRSAPGP